MIFPCPFVLQRKAFLQSIKYSYNDIESPNSMRIIHGFDNIISTSEMLTKLLIDFICIAIVFLHQNESINGGRNAHHTLTVIENLPGGSSSINYLDRVNIISRSKCMNVHSARCKCYSLQSSV